MISITMILAFLFLVPAIDDEKNILNKAETGIWKLVKNDGGVQTYVRWTKNSDGKIIRERKGEMTVDCTVENAVNMVTDARLVSKWMSGVSENYCLTRIDPSEWYSYTLFSVPWPFNKRDLVSLFKVATDPIQGTVNIAIASRDKYVPLKSGITRLVNYNALWVISRLGEKTIKIIFNATSTAPPVLPRAIQDPVLERIFHNNLVRLRATLSS